MKFSKMLALSRAVALLLVSSSLAMAAQTVTIKVSSTIILGHSDILGEADSQNANLLIAQQAILGLPATVQSLSFYVTAAAGQLRLGIYDASGVNGAPGKKVAETGLFTPVVGWNIKPVTTVLLPAGPYWLAYYPSSGALSFMKGSNLGTSYVYSLPFAPMPNTLTSSFSTSTSQWSLSATLQAIIFNRAITTPDNVEVDVSVDPVTSP